MDFTTPVYLRTNQSSAFKELDLAPARVRIKPEKKIFGISQKKIDHVVEQTMLGLTIASLVESVVKVARGILACIKKFAVSSTNLKITRLCKAIFFPGLGLSGIASLYSFGKDGAGLRNALVEGDKEASEDHSLGLLSNTANMTSAACDSAIAILTIQGSAKSAPKVAVMNVASAFIGAAAFGLYGMIEFLALRRIYRCVKKIKQIVGLNLTDFEKAKLQLEDLRSKVSLTQKEECAIQRSTNDFNYGSKYQAARLRKIRQKERKFVRRTNRDMLLLVKSHIKELSCNLESDIPEVKFKAISETNTLLKKYKGVLLKNLLAKTLGVVAAIIGVVSCLVVTRSPPGYLVAHGILIGISVGTILGAWYVEHRMNSKAFEEGINLLGIKLYDFKLPDLKEVTDASTCAYLQKVSKLFEKELDFSGVPNIKERPKKKVRESMV